MPIREDDFNAFMQDLVAEGVDPECSSGVDFIAAKCAQLREFLEEHDATDDEFPLFMVLFLDPFMRADDLSLRVKEELFERCLDALGLEIERTH